VNNPFPILPEPEHRPWWIRAIQDDEFWKWPSYILCAVLAVIVLFGLFGCASFDYEWQKANPAADKTVVVEVSNSDSTCRKLGAVGAGIERVLGCAQWTETVCTVYLEHDAPKWVRDHEAKHCEGWTHQ
jgi:hypothetical protein